MISLVKARWRFHYHLANLAQELCAVKPLALSSRLVLSGVLMAAGRLEEALQEALRAGETDPSDPRSQLGL